MINLVIFATDAKGLSSLNSIINEASERGINLFAMVCQDTQLRFPIQNKDRFEILTNCENTNPTYSQTLGVNLPFKPDWLIVARERWEPETSIIIEFKQKFGCKVGLVEANAHILNNAETILEMFSRNRFKDIIDVFFDHSIHISNQRKIGGFKGNSMVVGNPKYDINLTPDEDVIDNIKKYYKIDPNKKQVLLFSLINTNREKLFNKFEEYIKNNPTHQYFIKPYPGEPFTPQFQKEYFPKFRLDNVAPILEESHIWAMFNICDVHMGCLSSIFHASLLLHKEIIDLSQELDIPNSYLSKDHILNSTNIGVEDSKELWIRALNINEDQLKSILSEDVFKIIERENNIVWNTQKNLLHLFDDFNDGKASKRIIDYIENEK